jgi:hypothetical protein
MKREGHKFYWLYIKQKVLYKIFDNKLGGRLALVGGHGALGYARVVPKSTGIGVSDFTLEIHHIAVESPRLLFFFYHNIANYNSCCKALKKAKKKRVGKGIPPIYSSFS